MISFAGFTYYTFSSIYKGVERITPRAKTEFQGESVHALMDLVSSENYGFEEKNSAIWAIGQYADPFALPFMEQLNSQTGADSLPFDRKAGLSKKEIERAIKCCSKGNCTSWMYKKSGKHSDLACLAPPFNIS